MILPDKRKRPSRSGKQPVVNPDRNRRQRKACVTKAEARVEADRRVCLKSLAEFCKAAWHIIEPTTPYQHNWHIDVICEHLEALFWGTPSTCGPNAGQPIRNLVINIPPRHMKSILCSVMYPAWCWAHDPGRQFFYSSYAQSLSDDHAEKTKLLIESEWYRLRFGPTGNPALDADGYVAPGGKQRVREFGLSYGGKRLASSVKGKTTGAGGDILVTDDPHNVSQRESEKEMARVITWWSRAMASRGNDPRTFARLVVMQRVAEDDLAGWCINQGYDLLLIPARYEGNKQIGVLGHEDPREEENEPMWPERHGDAELTALESSLQDDAAGQLQQRPAPAGGRTFRMGAINRMSALVRDAILRPGQLDELITVWDLANKPRSKRNKKRSYSVGAVWGRKGNNVFLLDVWRDQIGFDDQLEAIETLARKWPSARPIYIENKAAGIQGAQILSRQVPGVLVVEPRGDKEQRARAVSVYFKAGNVWVPDSSIAPWVAAWWREHEYFPMASNDDQVDTTSMALDLLLVHGWAEPAMPEGGAVDPTSSPMRSEAATVAVERNRARIRARFGDESGAPGGQRIYTGPGYDLPD